MTSTWNRVAGQITRTLAAFRGDRSGNVAVTFAVAALPMVAAVGYAVDFSQALRIKTAMQAALDSTALRIARDAANLSNSELNAKAKAYFTTLFDRNDVGKVEINASYTTVGGSQVVLNGSASTPTTFLGIFGQDSLTVTGSSTTTWGSTRLRVALALDNTGSMASDGKMVALKSATKDLLKQLRAAATTNGDVYVSIIPFAKDVNVGAGNYNASWVDWTDWDNDNQSCGGYGSYYACTPKNHITWTGCITDRGPSNAPGASTWDQVATAPNGTPNSKWPAEQYNACPVAMQGLTYDWTRLNALTDAMQPNGATNQPIGLVWAWQSLVGGGPLSVPPKDANYQYQNIIILMSDGLNTQNRWYGNGSITSAAVDSRMYQPGSGAGTCANIKQSGVTIYTIHVNTDGDPTSTLLQNCAGSKDKMYDVSKFFTVTNASGLAAVFQKIGSGLTQLRVAQ